MDLVRFLRLDCASVNMKLLAISCLLALTASTKADGGLGLGGLVYAPGHASADYYAYPAYAFEYSVKDPHTGDNKAQWEKRDGDVVKGAYSLVEPDGSLRVVEYYADDKTGFNAVVKRLGPNLHPTGHVAPIGPISVGPVAKYDGLAGAPLLSGPLLSGGLYGGYGKAVSTVSILKDAPIIKPILAPAPIVPIIKEPIYHEPLYHEPIYKGPILPPLSIPEPIHKYGPLIGEGLLGPAPIVKAGPLIDYGYEPKGYYNRAPLGAPLLEYGPGLLEKGPLLSGWNGPYLGLKH